MNIGDLNIPENAKSFLQSRGYETLYPPQADAVEAGLLEGHSILVSAPTASGKTLIAMLAILSHLSRGGHRVVYLSPLRALAAEKHAEFAALTEISVAVAGDGADGAAPAPRRRRITAARTSEGLGRPSTGRRISEADIIIATNESMDLAMRNDVDWTRDVDLVIADEIHLIADEYRGPTLEIILARLKSRESRPQLVGLSATMSNANAIAEWLDCRLVSSSWRPVKLVEGVCDRNTGEVRMNDGRTFAVDADQNTHISLGVQTVGEGGQSLIFMSTRLNARSAAVKAAVRVSKLLTSEEKERLAGISERILPKHTDRVAESGRDATKLEEDLARLVKKGVAFHHAGLAEKQRSIVEEEFRNRNIKLLASTTTLAAGINLPARRVIISSVSRYNPDMGYNDNIPVLEYKQLCGRAGRPQYDRYGEAIIAASGNAQYHYEDFVMGSPEPLVSKIIQEKSMLTHLLSLVVLNPGIRISEIENFFIQTFGGQQSYKTTVRYYVSSVLDFLVANSMVTKEGKRCAATSFGKRVSALYINPRTAANLYDTVRMVPDDDGFDPDAEVPVSGYGALRKYGTMRNDAGQNERGRRFTMGLLQAITCCEEFYPKLSLGNKHYQYATEVLKRTEHEQLRKLNHYHYTRGLFALYEWIGERSEKKIAEILKVESGDMRRMIETASWITYAFREIARYADKNDLASDLDELRIRIRSGIKAELLGLVRLRGIGRVRARALYDAGIRTSDDVRSAPYDRIAAIKSIGPAVAKSIKIQVR